jgi:hypothetical protein
MKRGVAALNLWDNKQLELSFKKSALIVK